MKRMPSFNPNKLTALTLVAATSLGAMACGASSSQESEELVTREPNSAHIAYKPDGTAEQIIHTEMRDSTQTQAIHLRCLNRRMYALDPLNTGSSEEILVSGTKAIVACSDEKISKSDNLTLLKVLPDEYIANIKSGLAAYEVIDS